MSRHPDEIDDWEWYEFMVILDSAHFAELYRREREDWSAWIDLGGEG